MLELSVSKGRYIQTLSSFKDAGFDTIELSEGIIDMPANIKSGIAEFAHSNGLRLNVEIGKKDPRNQLSLDETIQGVERAFDLEPEVRLSRKSAIFKHRQKDKYEYLSYYLGQIYEL